MVAVQGCVSQALALRVMTEADRQLCFRYVGAAGGGDATALSLYPFLMELLKNMEVRGWYLASELFNSRGRVQGGSNSFFPEFLG